MYNVALNSPKKLLKLIDLKTENDMKEVISKMDNMFAKIDARFEHVEATIETKMTTIYWVIGVASAVLTLVLSLVSLYAGK